MGAVLFKGAPEELARVEAIRAGADPAVQPASIVLPRTRPKALA
jgi:hypothetical protein